MKTCPKCQHAVNDGYLFCPKCGTNLKNCHYCGKELPEGANFCPYCGKPIEWRTVAANNTSVEKTDYANTSCTHPEEEISTPTCGAPEDSPLKGFYLTDEALKDIRERFRKMRDEVIPGNSGTQPEWKESATMVSLSETYEAWVGHEDTITDSIHLTFSKICIGLTNVPWIKESEWPCSGQALIFDKSHSKRGDNPWDHGYYSCITHKAWLLNEPYGMPGLWRFEYYSSSSRS